nr:p26 [Calliteara abietis nucleopolyhedrovirus]
MEKYTVYGLTMSVDFVRNRVFCQMYNGEPLCVCIINQFENRAEFEAFNHYPGLACNVKLPKLKSLTRIKFVGFDKDKKLHTIRARLDTKLYYAHHRYGKYYYFGQIPAVTHFKPGDAANLYVGSPIFDETNTLVSFVSDYYISEHLRNNNKLIVPVTGESYRTQGRFCLTGRVRLFNENEIIDTAVQPHIDINVKYTKSEVKIFVVYNGEIVSYLSLKCKFAANVLIV